MVAVTLEQNSSRLKTILGLFSGRDSDIAFVDYSLEGLSKVIESKQANFFPLSENLSKTINFIYRVGDEYRSTIFHPKYPKPIHLVFDSENALASITVDSDDPRVNSSGEWNTLSEVLADLPSDFTQTDKGISRAIIKERGLTRR